MVPVFLLAPISGRLSVSSLVARRHISIPFSISFDRGGWLSTTWRHDLHQHRSCLSLRQYGVNVDIFQSSVTNLGPALHLGSALSALHIRQHSRTAVDLDRLSNSLTHNVKMCLCVRHKMRLFVRLTYFCSMMFPRRRRRTGEDPFDACGSLCRLNFSTSLLSLVNARARHSEPD